MTKIKKIPIILIIILFFSSCSEKIYNIDNEKTNYSLSQKFENDFLIGAAINEDQILKKDEKSLSIVHKEYNTITPENSLKWMFIEPNPGNFNFDVADKYVEYGLKNNMHIVGHALVWHSQLADYMNNVKDSTTMSYHIKNHINTLAGRYKGKINTWDVVNEALNEDGSLRQSVFFKTIGEGYIEEAFKLAEKADPKADLVYNDYNLCNSEKREGAINLVKNLQSKNIKINGVGIQAHWQLKTPSLEEIEKSIIAFSQLGLKVMFTELDISALPNPWELEGAEINQNFKKFEGDAKMNPYPKALPHFMEEKLAKRYEDIFRLFLKHRDKISRITFWGVTDKHSWLNDWPIKGRTNYPLLFDRNYQSKKAYQSIFDLTK
ncbi:MAG: endo-1,4-beta-xylanase [Polaribacter sp.]|nr:endo-1,4-beta-xylanase [Polaribacter sp.]